MATSISCQIYTTSVDSTRAFVAEGVRAPSPWGKLKGQVVLGRDKFVEKLRPLLAESGGIKEIPRAQRLLNRPSLEALFPAEITADRALRNEAIRRAYSEYGFGMTEIGRAAGVHYSTVSRVVRRGQK